MEKYQFKINQSRLAFNAAQVLQRHFDNFENSSEDERLKTQMKFLNVISGTINKLLKSVDFSLPESLQNNFYGIAINPELEDNSSLMKLLDNNNTDSFDKLQDLLSQLAGESDDSEEANEAINFSNPDNSFINNKLQIA